ncbi:helix-turn-helix transcriptional regulator [Reyranella sp. CPCC 100927]|uniref:ArsR/SmtB family transcription factor n=1 Tax=Reyranella sp. CPCC 100927 TaxID=2599616 RepID=UPI0011B498B2|nr:metalloregulator ArsR/SmtB family transcription factor [Reyranella sp. CPCC 100927]TWT03930.1 helix-turn-helix transcriptional regulator [Reyranella sp. CPCC 100927]
MRKPVVKTQRLDLPEDRATQLADLFRLLGDTSRLRIVAACLEQPTAVSAIAEKLDLSLSLVSHHLRLLKAARIVRAERQGKNVFYAADDEHIRRVIVDMLEHVAEQRDED